MRHWACARIHFLGEDQKTIVAFGEWIIRFGGMLLNLIPACRSELKLSIMEIFSILETVKVASAVCQSFLDGVVISFKKYSEAESTTTICKNLLKVF